MIRKVKKSELSTCADVIKQSFLPVAKEFNITKKIRRIMLHFLLILKS